jgi:hypothetical protein
MHLREGKIKQKKKKFGERCCKILLIFSIWPVLPLGGSWLILA